MTPGMSVGDIREFELPVNAVETGTVRVEHLECGNYSAFTAASDSTGFGPTVDDALEDFMFNAFTLPEIRRLDENAGKAAAFGRFLGTCKVMPKWVLP